MGAMLFAILIHGAAGWYLSLAFNHQPVHLPTQPIEFKVVKSAEPVIAAPVPLPMSSTPPAETSLPKPQPKPVAKPLPTIKREIPVILPPAIEPLKQTVETQYQPRTEEKSSLSSFESDDAMNNLPVDPAPSDEGHPGGGGGGGVGDGNGLSEGGPGNMIATGPGGGGIGTGFGTGIGTGAGPGVGSGIGTGTGSGVGPGIESVIAPIFDAAYLSNPIPEYPSAARKLRLQGTVIVRVLVTPEGKPDVVQIEKSSGVSLLDGSALKAVKKWSFVPARSGDHSVSAWVDVPIRFRLN
jgi:TonB family protein